MSAAAARTGCALAAEPRGRATICSVAYRAKLRKVEARSSGQLQLARMSFTMVPQLACEAHACAVMGEVQIAQPAHRQGLRDHLATGHGGMRKHRAATT